jgi:hypothetical protein
LTDLRTYKDIHGEEPLLEFRLGMGRVGDTLVPILHLAGFHDESHGALDCAALRLPFASASSHRTVPSVKIET